MNRPKTDVTRAVALAALLGGAGACAGSEGPTPSATGEDPVESALANLGVPISGCANTGFASGTLTLTLASDPMVLSAPGGVFAANGIKCTQTVSGVDKQLKTTDVTKININGTVNDDKIILDFLPGTFGTKVLAANGGITIDFNTAQGGNDSVMLRATSSSDTYRFASAPTSGSATDVYIEVTNDKTADVDIKLGTGTLSLTASMGGGNDTVIANTPGTDIDKFSATTLTVTGLPATLGVTAYGGPGDDKFTSGLGADAFYGGDGNDTFKMNATTDGADIYQGDLGTDTVDYSNRTGDLKVELGPATPAVEGVVDLRAPALYGAGGTLNGKVLAMAIDGIRVETTFSSPASPADILSQINAAANTAFGTTTATYVGLNGKNHLVAFSPTNVLTTSFVKIEDDPAVVADATNNAETTLGLTPAVTAAASFPVLGADLTGVTTANLDTKTLILIVDGVYVKVLFTTASSASASTVVAAIDGAIAAALNTTGVKYATQDPATNKLSLTAKKSIEVKLGTAAYTLAGGAASAATALGFRSSLTSTADMTTAGLYATPAASSTIIGKVVALVIDGARVEVDYTSAAPADAAAVVTAINSAANTELKTSGVKYASLDLSNHLVINSGTDVGAVSAVRAAGDSAIAAPANTISGAETVLGLSTAASANGATVVGTNDVSSAALYGGSGTLLNTQLKLVINGEYVVVDLSAGVASSAALLTAIDTAANTALGTTGLTYISLVNSKYLQISGTWVAVKSGVAASTYTSAQSVLTLKTTQNARRDVYDADDGLFGEFDDVRYSTENIISGSGNDVLIGNALKNSIKGGAGNDLIAGGAMASATSATDADALLGEAGDDTFVMPVFDAKAVLTGGDGDNVADFSGRSLSVTLKNNGTADDGESSEAANIGSDIKTLIGGFGADFLIGGSGDDTLIGGPGADELTGSSGFDTADYSASPAAVTVPLCFGMAISGCSTGSGGYAASDKVYQMEHLIGSVFGDTLNGAAAQSTVDLTIEGRAGDDIITGGAGNDTLYGDAGNDTLHGGDGDDQLQGDAGDDALDGGNGDADICLSDSADVTTAKIACEL